MEQIVVKSQAELDSINTDYNGRIIIEFGTPYKRAVVNRRFRFSIVARENSSVEAWGNSSVEAWGNSSVVAWGNSSVVARENSSVVAWGNSQVVDYTDTHDIKTNGNARIVYEPKTIDEYLDYYGIDKIGDYVRLYKAVHKRSDSYVSDFDKDFTYTVGSVVESMNGFNTDVFDDCGAGLHIAYKEWCVDYGRDWDDLAILEVEAEIKSIIVPLLNPGKVRAPKVKVIREVPLDECGLLGKMIAKRRAEK